MGGRRASTAAERRRASAASGAAPGCGADGGLCGHDHGSSCGSGNHGLSESLLRRDHGSSCVRRQWLDGGGARPAASPPAPSPADHRRAGSSPLRTPPRSLVVAPHAAALARRRSARRRAACHRSACRRARPSPLRTPRSPVAVPPAVAPPVVAPHAAALARRRFARHRTARAHECASSSRRVQQSSALFLLSRRAVTPYPAGAGSPDSARMVTERGGGDEPTTVDGLGQRGCDAE